MDSTLNVQSLPYKATGTYTYDANGNLLIDPHSSARMSGKGQKRWLLVLGNKLFLSRASHARPPYHIKKTNTFVRQLRYLLYLQ